MPSVKPRVGLRIERNLLSKFRHVAEYNERTANKELEYLIKRYISSYEKEHGPIGTSNTKHE